MEVKKEKEITLRPHHGMCFNFYVGKGYSEDFTDHMGKVIKFLYDNPDQLICVKSDTDVVCKNCPNNEAGQCKGQRKVIKYDNRVLKTCKISNGSKMTYQEFRKIVKKEILDKGLRSKICGDCQWNYLCN